jgi:predicted lipoprotein with Yx(FWY)xxD motif
MRTHSRRRLVLAPAAVAGLSGDNECLSFWTPRMVRRGTRSRGTVGSLGTIRRPDGKTQVTYRGRPFYSFYQDGRGNASGEGFKDVGTWHAVAPSGR